MVLVLSMICSLAHTKNTTGFTCREKQITVSAVARYSSWEPKLWLGGGADQCLCLLVIAVTSCHMVLLGTEISFLKKQPKTKHLIRSQWLLSCSKCSTGSRACTAHDQKQTACPRVLRGPVTPTFSYFPLPVYS